MGYTSQKRFTATWFDICHRIAERRGRWVEFMEAPIGVFDSGVGGLSVLREIRQQLPGQSVIYLADQAHVPYGGRPLDEVRKFSVGIAQFLIERGARVVVVACNTASAAALLYLRESFPNVDFVGMEPAVKPAAEQTETKVIGVLATPATFQGQLYTSVVERFASGVKIYQDVCPGLVQEIEEGNLNSAKTRSILENALLPMIENNLDTVVLGCTHYPFVIPLIKDIVGTGVRVIDPAPAVALQTARVWCRAGLDIGERAKSRVYFVTTGQANRVSKVISILLGQEMVNLSTGQWSGDGTFVTL